MSFDCVGGYMSMRGQTTDFDDQVAQFFVQYMIALSALTFVVSIWDKYCAVHRLRRVPERVLLALSFLGGTPGAKLARMISGHKRLKTGFTISLNLIAFFQIGVAIAAWSGKYGQGGYDLTGFALTSQEAEVSAPVETSAPPRRFGPGS